MYLQECEVSLAELEIVINKLFLNLDKATIPNTNINHFIFSDTLMQ